MTVKLIASDTISRMIYKRSHNCPRFLCYHATTIRRHRRLVFLERSRVESSQVETPDEPGPRPRREEGTPLQGEAESTIGKSPAAYLTFSSQSFFSRDADPRSLASLLRSLFPRSPLGIVSQKRKLRKSVKYA